jgi:hypothetical protein
MYNKQEIREKEADDLINRVKPDINIIKITLEFDDHFLIFENEDAIKWLKGVDNAVAFSLVNGIDYLKHIDLDKAYIKK